ncbi:hypothetical protein Pmani_022230 [Petrolisthes manimaculis]|uniref:Tyrosine-protein phosphatase domain-containing protein n=1 Tax=Petrolisthes manimaculis TaxID=1843537 RepID=A0AAE1U4H1_9EUCA|nr:hypothetical protein Pmani_022230 [Petrolisthes manimaculis]
MAFQPKSPMMKEFYDLESRRPRLPTTAALLIPNLTKNRTSSIVPYSNDVTRPLPHSDVTGTLPSDVTTLQSDVTTLPSDVTTLPSDVTTLPRDVTTLPRDVTDLPSNVTGTLPNDDYINATIVNPKYPRFWPLPGDRDQHLPPCYPAITVVQLATEKGELPPLPQHEDEDEEYHYHWRTKEERRDVEALQTSPYFYVTDLVIYSGGGQRRVVRHYHCHRCLESHVLYPATLHLLHHVFNHHTRRRLRGGGGGGGGPIVLTCPDGADLCGGFLVLARLIQREVNEEEYTRRKTRTRRSNNKAAITHNTTTNTNKNNNNTNTNKNKNKNKNNNTNTNNTNTTNKRENSVEVMKEGTVNVHEAVQHIRQYLPQAVKRTECYYFIYRCLVTFLTWQEEKEKEEGGKEEGPPRGTWPTKRPLQTTPSHHHPTTLLLLKRIKSICPELPIPPSLMMPVEPSYT